MRNKKTLSFFYILVLTCILISVSFLSTQSTTTISSDDVTTTDVFGTNATFTGLIKDGNLSLLAFDWDNLYNVPPLGGGGGNPFDQWLNTTDSVHFSVVGTPEIRDTTKIGFTIGGTEYMNLTNSHLFTTRKLIVETVAGAAEIGCGGAATGDCAVALNFNTLALGDYSTAMGSHSEARGLMTVASGFSTNATGNYATTMGAHTNAEGICSTGMGMETNATGPVSMATGYNTYASGVASFTGGQYMQPLTGVSTFVWGSSMGPEKFSPADCRFLIFPQGDVGRVGINTDAPLYELDVLGNIGFNSYLYHRGDDNTNLQVYDDNLRLRAGGEIMIALHEEATQDTLKFGDGGNIDVSVNTGGASEALLIDGATGNVNVSEDFEVCSDTTLGTSSNTVTINNILHLSPLAAAPGAPVEGDIYYNSVNHKAYCYDGTVWQGLW